MPKFCVHCGAPIKPGEKFCTNCGAQLVKNLYDTTPIEPTDIEPTEVKPTEIEPTDIKPTDIQPTDIKPTDIQPTDIKPTDIKPTEIEPTSIEPGVFNSRFFRFFIHPNALIFGILSFAFILTTVILISVNGFKWWILFFLLLALGSLFEVIFSLIQCPSNNGSKNIFKKIPSWLGIGKDKKTMVKSIIGGVSGIASSIVLAMFLLISLFMGFKNFVVLDGYSFRYSYTASGYNPETDYEVVTFHAGNKATLVYYSHGEATRTYNCTYWRIGKGCGVQSYEYVEADGTVVQTPSWETADTTNWDIISAKELLSGSCHFYRTR